MGGQKDQDKRSPATLALYHFVPGILFVAGQTFAWLQLRSQGFGLATNISYSFFYVLTVAHALHLLGGLGGLVRVIGKAEPFRPATEHSGRHFALLAFHGRAVVVSAFAAVDEALDQFESRRK